MNVKMCGFARAQDVEYAVTLPLWGLGFVCVPGSPRTLDAAQMRDLAARVPARMARVGVFQNPKLEDLARAASEGVLTHFQLHGQESPELVARAPLPVIKAFRLEDNVYTVADYRTNLAGVLLDGPVGGSGRTIDWTAAREFFSGATGLAFLAGGLRAENVQDALRLSGAPGLDLASGVEERPGIKSAAKMRDLMTLMTSLAPKAERKDAT